MLRRLLGRFRRRAQPSFGPARVAAWNTKVLGAVLARQCYQAGLAGPGIPLPEQAEWAGLTSCLCRQADLEAPWLHHWCGALRMVPFYHRKVWEAAFIAQALWEAGRIGPGQRALGFAVGRELLPGFLAARGVEVLATDLDPADPRATRWRESGQHAQAAAAPPEDAAARRLSFRPLDMKRIPRELHGQFDILWSACALEHLGSLRAGEDFVLEAMRCLRPGGIAVHTTEFDLDPQGPPLARGDTVLFQARHIEQLSRRLLREGHRLRPVDLDPGAGLLDQFVDLPPYGALADRWPISIPVETPHLRVVVEGRIATSIGLIIQARP